MPLPIYNADHNTTVQNENVSSNINDLGLTSKKPEPQQNGLYVDLPAKKIEYSNNDVTLSLRLDGGANLDGDFGWDKNIDGIANGDVNFNLNQQMGSNVSMQASGNFEITMPFTLNTGNIFQKRMPSLAIDSKNINFNVKIFVVKITLKF